MALKLISSPRECGGLSGSLGEGRGCDLCTLVFILKLVSSTFSSPHVALRGLLRVSLLA
jgi:hypothetical protein